MARYSSLFALSCRQTVCNNLLHGGKHVRTYWNDVDRMRLLLETTIALLDDLANQMGMFSDYLSEY